MDELYVQSKVTEKCDYYRRNVMFMQEILYDALIITMNEKREILNRSALVIEGKNILEIGDSETMLKKYPKAYRRDCRGKVIIPGFINLHTHQTLSIIRGSAEDLGTAPAYTKSVPQGQSLSIDESRIMATLGAVEAVRFGSTYIVDMYTNCETNAVAFENVGIKAAVCEMVHDMDFYSLYKHEYHIDEAMGDALLERNIRLIEKWRNHEKIDCCIGLHAPDTCSKVFIQKILKIQEHYNVPIATHLAQSPGEVARIHAYAGGLSPTAYYAELGVLDRQLYAAHCIYVNDDDIRLLSDHHVNVVHVPEGNAKGGMVAPIHKMRNTGINLTMGTDNGSADMIDAMRISLCIGRVMAGRYDDPTTMQVLEMATINGAKAIGKEKEIGSLEPGKHADFLVLDYRKSHLIPCLNPLGILLHTAIGSDIEDVYINGRKIVEHGKVLTIDEEILLKEAQMVAKKQWMAVNQDINPEYILNL